MAPTEFSVENSFNTATMVIGKVLPLGNFTECMIMIYDIINIHTHILTVDGTHKV